MVEVLERATITTDAEEQLVVFKLGDESYGVSIEAVNTIIRLPDITAVPNAPTYVKGVINLRGLIVPVISLRSRFGLGETESTKATRVVVVENEGRKRALMVDELLGKEEVVIKNLGGMQDVPGVAGGTILGDGRVGLILDLAGVISSSAE